MMKEKRVDAVAIPQEGWMRSHMAEAQLRNQGIEGIAYTVSYAEGGLLVIMNYEGELSVYFVDQSNEGNRLAPSLARQAWAAATACDRTFARA